jgi:hypothetical protein
MTTRTYERSPSEHVRLQDAPSPPLFFANFCRQNFQKKDRGTSLELEIFTAMGVLIDTVANDDSLGHESTLKALKVPYSSLRATPNSLD